MEASEAEALKRVRARQQKRHAPRAHHIRRGGMRSQRAARMRRARAASLCTKGWTRRSHPPSCLSKHLAGQAMETRPGGRVCRSPAKLSVMGASRGTRTTTQRGSGGAGASGVGLASALAVAVERRGAPASDLRGAGTLAVHSSGKKCGPQAQEAPTRHPQRQPFCPHSTEPRPCQLVRRAPLPRSHPHPATPPKRPACPTCPRAVPSGCLPPAPGPTPLRFARTPPC